MSRIVVRAQTPCGGQYDQNCPFGGLVLDKQVLQPTSNQFVENLGTADSFIPGAPVTYRITAKNTNTVPITITVTDTLPEQLSTTNTLTWDWTLNPGERKTQDIQALVKPATQLPDKPVFCTTNVVRAANGNLSTQDTSQICIQLRPLGVSVLPTTGISDWLFYLPALVLLVIGLRYVWSR